MFIGRYYHTLEEKNRVSLPKKFRDQETNWIVTRGLDGGLFLFVQAEFEDRLRELHTRSFTKKDYRDFIRLLANDAQEVSVDRNGRITLPEYLKTFAHLSKEVVIVGSFSRVEIWDMETYHAYIDQIENRAEEIAEHLASTSEDDRVVSKLAQKA
jgi:MraZ protein